MSRLPLIDPAQAQGRRHELFEAVKRKMGRVPNMVQAMANSPAVLQGYLGFSGGLSEGVLDPKLRERIALEVGQANGCNYCVAAHDMLGRLAGLDPAERMQNRKGRSADPKADAALHFARLVRDARGAVDTHEIERIREAGFSDAEVTEIIAHVAMNVFTNIFNNAAETPIDFPAAEPLA